MKKLLIVLVILLGFNLPKAQAQYLISTYAGNGIVADTGFGGPATAASFCNTVHYVSYDPFGQLIVTTQSSVRMVTPASLFYKIAGSSVSSYTGDGGPATAALLSSVYGTATDAAGNLYICDASDHAIRKVNPAGILSTIAGTLGTLGYSGDGGPATSALLHTPSGLAIDRHNNIFFADADNHCIRRIDAAGIITTIAGKGTPGFSGDAGPATTAQLNYPSDVTVDTSGNVYIADIGNHRIRKVNSAGIISTVAGSAGGFGGDGGPATAAKFAFPGGIAIDKQGNLYISDDQNLRIRMVNTAGIITTIAGNGISGYSEGDGCNATSAQLNYPEKVCIDTLGNIYIADGHNYRVRKLTPNFKPEFTGGHGQHINLLKDAPADSLNSLLNANDTNQGQAETWAIVRPPTHGTFGGAYATVCPNGVMTPTSFYYTPGAGYIGGDTMKVAVTDCGGGSDTTTLYIHIDAHAATPSIVGGLAGSFHLYPDPSNGTFTCMLSSPVSEEAHIIITNFLGQKVKELIVLTNKETAVQLNAPPGVYFVNMVTAYGKWCGKVVIGQYVR